MQRDQQTHWRKASISWYQQLHINVPASPAFTNYIPPHSKNERQQTLTRSVGSRLRFHNRSSEIIRLTHPINHLLCLKEFHLFLPLCNSKYMKYKLFEFLHCGPLSSEFFPCFRMITEILFLLLSGDHKRGKKSFNTLICQQEIIFFPR